jgi:hypothetical protein
MNHWPFVIAAYALVRVGTGGVTLWSYVAMRRAEARADALTRRG